MCHFTSQSRPSNTSSDGRLTCRTSLTTLVAARNSSSMFVVPRGTYMVEESNKWRPNINSIGKDEAGNVTNRHGSHRSKMLAFETPSLHLSGRTGMETGADVWQNRVSVDTHPLQAKRDAHREPRRPFYILGPHRLLDREQRQHACHRRP